MGEGVGEHLKYMRITSIKQSNAETVLRGNYKRENRTHQEWKAVHRFQDTLYHSAESSSHVIKNKI